MEKPSSKVLVSVGLALQLGFSIAVPLIVFIFLGIWMDKKLSVMPLFTILGVFLSLAVSMIEIYQIIKNTQKK